MKPLTLTGLLALAAAIAQFPIAPSASAAICGTPICADPGTRGTPRCIELLNGRVLTVWNGGASFGVRAMLSDSGGRPAWPFLNGVQLGPDSLPPLTNPPLLCRLSESSAIEAHTAQASPGANHDVLYSAIWNQPGSPPDSMQTQAVLLPQLPDVRQRRVAALVRQDNTHALLALWSASSPTLPIYTRIEPVGIPGSGPSLWPAAGVVLADSITLDPQGACTDSEMGCFVLVRAAHRCNPQPFQTCPMELRLYHLLADGSRDPAWGSDGFIVTTHPSWDLTGQITSDTQGGAYVCWWETINDTLRVVGVRVLANGTIAPGWNSAGQILLRSNTLVQGDFCITASPVGNLLAVIPIDFNMSPYVIERDPAGNVPAGWPADGVALRTSAQYGSVQVSNFSLGVALDGRIVATWFETVTAAGTTTFSVLGVALGPHGERLPGWPDTGLRICDQYAPNVSLAAPIGNWFSAVWLDTDIRLASYAISDGSTPTMASAVLLGHTLEGSRLTAIWRVVASSSQAFGAVRSVDEGPFEPIGAPTRTGSEALLLTDSLPAATTSIRYAITTAIEGETRIVSEVLEIPADRPRREGPALLCPTVQSGPALEFELAAWSSAGPVSITMFDLAGRRIARAEVALDAVGGAHAWLPWGRAGPGVYQVEARDQAGARATRRVVRIR